MKLAVLLAAPVMAAALTACGGQSYPHAWCGPVISTLTASHGTETSLETSLGTSQSRDRAPVGKLLNDLFALGAARSAVTTGSIADAPQNLAAEKTALAAVASDLKTVNSQCGQPPGAYRHDRI